MNPKTQSHLFPHRAVMFTHSIAYAVSLGFALLACCSSAPVFAQISERNTLVGPERAILQNTELHRWEFGMHLGFDKREYLAGSEDVEVDWTRLEARIAGDITPVLQARLDLGAAEAEVEGADGETGLRAGGLLRLALLEHVLDPSPIAGSGSKVRLGIEGGLRHTESNLDEDFKVDDLFVTTDLWYHRGWPDVEDRLSERRNVSSSWRLGLTWLTSDGELGGADLEENRNFAVELGLAFGFRNRWVARTDLRLFGDEREITIGGNYRF